MRETKMGILLGSYKMFIMKSDETVTQMFKRSNEIVNGLANQGKISTDVENMNKLPTGITKGVEPRDRPQFGKQRESNPFPWMN